MQKTLFENTSETMPSMTQEAKLHQTLNILSPWSWTLNRQNCEKLISVVWKPPCLWYYVTAAQTMAATFRSPWFLMRNQLLILLRIPVQFSSVTQSCPTLYDPIDCSIRWPKDWSFSFNISPSNEYSALLSFRMEWLDCLAVQGTLKSLLQHHSSKVSILQHSAFHPIQWCHSFSKFSFCFFFKFYFI